MRTAVFGGTFDPVHLGHLHLIHSLVKYTDYERIIIIPAASPPHKCNEPEVTGADRLAMLSLALDDFNHLYKDVRETQLIIDTCEIDRGGVSYMYDTVSELYQRYSIDDKIGLVIGDDLVAGLRRWYRFNELRNLVEIVVVRRTKEELRELLPPGVKIKFLSNPIFTDSSTQVRTLIAGGKRVEEELGALVSSSVANYILENGLYKT